MAEMDFSSADAEQTLADAGGVDGTPADDGTPMYSLGATHWQAGESEADAGYLSQPVGWGGNESTTAQANAEGDDGGDWSSHLPEVQDLRVVSPVPFLDSVVRKVDPDMADVFDPLRYGMAPSDPNAALRPAEHALNQHAGGASPYLSASERPLGASNIDGKRYWVDLPQVRDAGAEIISNADLVDDMDALVQENPNLAHRANLWKGAQAVEGEMLIKGDIPPQALETGSMRALKGLGTAAGIAGAGLTAYELYEAGQESIEEGSAAPLVAETIRQGGSWAGAWAGAQAGAALGGALGLTTGPGAVVTAIGGGIVGGVAGFVGADFVADLIHPDGEDTNEQPGTAAGDSGS